MDLVERITFRYGLLHHSRGGWKTLNYYHEHINKMARNFIYALLLLHVVCYVLDSYCNH